MEIWYAKISINRLKRKIGNVLGPDLAYFRLSKMYFDGNVGLGNEELLLDRKYEVGEKLLWG